MGTKGEEMWLVVALEVRKITTVERLWHGRSNEFYRRASPGRPDEDVWAYVDRAKTGSVRLRRRRCPHLPLQRDSAASYNPGAFCAIAPLTFSTNASAATSSVFSFPSVHPFSAPSSAS